MKALATTLATLAFSSLCGCSGLTDVKIEETGVGTDADEVRLAASSRTVTVTGTITSPNLCQELSATLRRSAGSLELRVVSTPIPVPCPQAIGEVGYLVAIPDLAPGSYRVRVLHHRAQTQWDDWSFSAQIEVPR